MSTQNTAKTKKSESAPKSSFKLIQCPTCSITLKSSNINQIEQHECLNLNDKKFFLFENLANLNAIEHSKDLATDLTINKDYLFDYAFINSSIMNMLKIDLGDLLLVQYFNIQSNSLIKLLSVAWPSDHINQDQISLSKYNYMLNIGNFTNIKLNDKSNYLLIKKLNKASAKQSKEIRLKFIEKLSTINIFETDLAADEENLILNLLKEIYLHKIVAQNQYIFINYIGQKLVFQLEQIDSSIENDIANELEDKLNFQDRTIKYEFEYFKQSDLKINYYIVCKETKFLLVINESNNKKEINLNESLVDFESIGGLEKEISQLKDFFITPFEFGELYKKIGVKLSKGVILYGPGGCGKSLLANAVCHQSKCNYVELKIADIYSRNLGEAEEKLKLFFTNAWSKSPCIVLIDEIDTLCSRRESLNLESDKRIVSLFSNMVDKSKSKNILFLCTTNKLDLIDLSLRRPGRFDKELEIPIPNQTARLMILKKKLKSLSFNLTEQELNDISQNCHGYVGADLEMLVQEAGNICIKRLIHSSENSMQSITSSDLTGALRRVKPSAMREITFDIPKVYWSQIGGQADLKKKLQQAILWPIKHAASFKRLKIKPPRGILMYGPPGCSKTMIAKALATETGLNFIAVKGPELFSKWVGESERMVREIFRKARNAAPSIIFFDEIDAIASERSNSSNKNNNVGDRVLAQMLNEIDGVENLNEVTIVAATNRPDMIDKALMRPGRLDRIVYVKLPDWQTRKEIFEIKLKEMPVDETIDLDVLVKHTERYSGAELTAVCNEAALMALDQDINANLINMKHFEMALDMVTPRTSEETIKYFDAFCFK